MLKLRRLEVEGFGPFASTQVIDFPTEAGVSVIYGENMRGKTSLLNAIRYAFFGKAVARGSRDRGPHTISNRELASEGRYGFNVALDFEHDGVPYELARHTRSTKLIPSSDSDFEQHIMLKRRKSVLGPEERIAALARVFPPDISRFFLFDGELLQQYEELLTDSPAGTRISEEIERILGVPVLKQGKKHLLALADDADKEAAREAAKHKETQALGNALQQATQQKEAHQKDLRALLDEQETLLDSKAELERHLNASQKHSALLVERDRDDVALEDARREEQSCRAEIKRLMGDAWRTLLLERVRVARSAAQERARHQLELLTADFRRRALTAGRCEICLQGLSAEASRDVAARLDSANEAVEDVKGAFAHLSELERFKEVDVRGQIELLSKRLRELKFRQVTLKANIEDLDVKLSDADPESLRKRQVTFGEVVKKLAIAKNAIEQTEARISEREDAVAKITKKLDASGAVDLRRVQLRSSTLRAAGSVFSSAVERYKNELRRKVEDSASTLFLSMTTEKKDYAKLSINDSYGLRIIHRDGKAEEARSAGAEHVVALALMGALQQNAPLRGPIVMDSPFGRLDATHSANVVQSLPLMAEQVVLLVYESEMDRDKLRKLLGPKLKREYELQYVSARRTNVRIVR